jgi:hypothetical protein
MTTRITHITSRVAHTSFCDVCDLSAIRLERTVAPGTALRGATIAYMPNGGNGATRRSIELTVATSMICPVTHHPLTPSSAEEGGSSHTLRRRSNGNPCACSIPLCATRLPGRGRACPTLPGSAVIYAEGTASRPPTAKGLADIGVQSGSAGPALRPCGFSSGAGSCRAASKIIRILMRHALKN